MMIWYAYLLDLTCCTCSPRCGLHFSFSLVMAAQKWAGTYFSVTVPSYDTILKDKHSRLHTLKGVCATLDCLRYQQGFVFQGLNQHQVEVCRLHASANNAHGTLSAIRPIVPQEPQGYTRSHAQCASQISEVIEGLNAKI